MYSDSTSIETIHCEEEETPHKDTVLSANKKDKGTDNQAFVIEESEYSEEPLDDVKIVKVNGYQEQEIDEDEERQKWSNPLEFLLSCISMSVSCS